MIIGLSGYARSGKDTIAKYLIEEYGFTRRAFADPIREFLYEINPYLDGPRLRDVVDDYGWEVAKANPVVRELLQSTGLGARKLFGERFWVTQAFVGVSSTDKIVITDVRFKNEVDAIRDKGGEVWRINRAGVGPINNHVSETELDYVALDKIIVNSTGLDSLKSQIDALLNR